MITTKKSVTRITIDTEEQLSLLFTAMCYSIKKCEKDDSKRAKEVQKLCEEIRYALNGRATN